MKLSARNQIMGFVQSVKLGNGMVEVIVDIGGNEVLSTEVMLATN
jgi:molybdopterin-binding protein